MPRLFDLSSLSSGDLISVCNKMTARSLVHLRQTCRLMDYFIIDKREHIAVRYTPDLNICIASIGKDKNEIRQRFSQFLLAFAGFSIQNVFCLGVCNGFCQSSFFEQNYLSVLRQLKWDCKVMTVSQVKEVIVEIIRPELLVIEDYSRGDLISSCVNNLELKWLTGSLPDLTINLNIRNMFIKPATSIDFLEVIRNCIELIKEEKMGSVDFVEIVRSHATMSIKCKSYLQESVEIVQDAFGRGEIYLENPKCLTSQTSYSKLIRGKTKTRRITVSNLVEEQECTILVKIQTA